MTKTKIIASDTFISQVFIDIMAILAQLTFELIGNNFVLCTFHNSQTKYLEKIPNMREMSKVFLEIMVSYFRNRLPIYL